MSDSPPDTAPAIRATAMAADANPYGKIFVGWLMGQMALAAGSVASRHSGARCPVVAADGFGFTAPVSIGEEVIVVGHSRGGLIARYASARPGAEGADRSSEISTT